MDKPRTVTHGPYTIKAGPLQGRTIARAFVTGGAPGMVAEAEGASVDDAIAALTADLDARTADEAAHRRTVPGLPVAVPTQAEYARALQVIKPHAAHRTLLRALALAGEEGLTVKALTFDAGYHDDGATAHQLGVIADDLGRALGIEVPTRAGSRGADPAVALIAASKPGGWTMHPELRAAVLAAMP